MINDILIYGGLFGAVVFLVATILIYVKFHIPRAIGELTGSTKRKELKRIQKGEYRPNKKSDFAMKGNSEKLRVRSGKTTMQLNAENYHMQGDSTELLSTFIPGEETTLLNGSDVGVVEQSGVRDPHFLKITDIVVIHTHERIPGI